MATINLFEFDDYRSYLRGFIATLPNHGRGELSKLARLLRVNNTLISQVLAGSREFSLEQGHEIAKYLALTELEMDYFSLLIQISRSGSEEHKLYLHKKKLRLRHEALKLVKRVEHQHQLSEASRAIFYSSWLYSAVHLFTSMYKEGVSASQISHQFHLTSGRTQEIIGFLAQNGLIKENNSKWCISIQSTFIEQGSVHLVHHHRNWRMKASEFAENLADSDLMITAQVSVSRQDFEKIREEMVQFIKKISIQVIDSPPENLVSLNLDWVKIV